MYQEDGIEAMERADRDAKRVDYSDLQGDIWNIAISIVRAQQSMLALSPPVHVHVWKGGRWVDDDDRPV